MDKTPTQTEKTILDLEHRYWEAIRDNDVETALRLNEDPMIVTGAQGVASIDAATFRQMMGMSKWKLSAFKLDQITVRMLGADCAIIAYMVHEQMTVEGKPLELTAADTSTWVRRDGQWKCAMHTESVKGDPFGRA